MWKKWSDGFLRLDVFLCVAAIPDEGARHHHDSLHPEGWMHQVEALQVLAQPPVNHLVAALRDHGRGR